MIRTEFTLRFTTSFTYPNFFYLPDPEVFYRANAAVILHLMPAAGIQQKYLRYLSRIKAQCVISWRNLKLQQPQPHRMTTFDMYGILAIFAGIYNKCILYGNDRVRVHITLYISNSYLVIK